MSNCATPSLQQQAEQDDDAYAAEMADVDVEHKASQLATAVTVRYTELPLDSKEKLEYHLKLWYRWHQQQYSTGAPSTSTVLEGTLQIDTTCQDNPVWTDKPIVLRGSSFAANFNSTYERDAEVPGYEREAGFALSSPVEGRPSKRSKSSRCFNCGSYSHSLPECHKPIDRTTVETNRKEFNQAKNEQLANTPGKRYFEAEKQSGGTKFTGIVPGQLSDSLQAALGLSSGDPPPWLHRMAALGVPAAYADGEGADTEQAAAEVEIHVFDDTGGLGLDPEKETVVKLDGAGTSGGDKKQSVKFPGIDAAVPDGANSFKWNKALSHGKSLKSALEQSNGTKPHAPERKESTPQPHAWPEFALMTSTPPVRHKPAPKSLPGSNHAHNKSSTPGYDGYSPHTTHNKHTDHNTPTDHTTHNAHSNESAQPQNSGKGSALVAPIFAALPPSPALPISPGSRQWVNAPLIPPLPGIAAVPSVKRAPYFSSTS